MGLLDELKGAVVGVLSGPQGSNLGQAALDMLAGREGGGLQGLAGLFEQKGLGPIVASWIGTGPNQAISAEQLQKVLGSDRVCAIAEKAGLSPEQVRLGLAELLPRLVDRLTPNGQIPQEHGLGQAGLAALRSILG